VPATDEVWRLQSGDDPESRAFQHFADHGHYRGKGGTRQGIYVCTASGELLASANTLRADDVLKMLKDALEKFRGLPKSSRRVPDWTRTATARRWESQYPSGGLVLVSTNRDLPERLDAAQRSKGRWNRDHVWFSDDEARRWLPPELRVGNTQRVAEQLVERLARFHFVDNVRGQTIPYSPEQVRTSKLETEITAIDGDLIHLRITGSTRSVSDGAWTMGKTIWTPQKNPPHGVLTRVLGNAAYDSKRGAFVRFDLVAIGRRWGATENNGRRRDPKPGAIGFVLSLSPPTPAGRVAPAFVDLYNAAWIVKRN